MSWKLSWNLFPKIWILKSASNQLPSNYYIISSYYLMKQHQPWPVQCEICRSNWTSSCSKIGSLPLKIDIERKETLLHISLRHLQGEMDPRVERKLNFANSLCTFSRLRYFRELTSVSLISLHLFAAASTCVFAKPICWKEMYPDSPPVPRSVFIFLWGGPSQPNRKYKNNSHWTRETWFLWTMDYCRPEGYGRTGIWVEVAQHLPHAMDYSSWWLDGEQCAKQSVQMAWQ